MRGAELWESAAKLRAFSRSCFWVQRSHYAKNALVDKLTLGFSWDTLCHQPSFKIVDPDNGSVYNSWSVWCNNCNNECVHVCVCVWVFMQLHVLHACISLHVVLGRVDMDLVQKITDWLFSMFICFHLIFTPTWRFGCYKKYHNKTYYVSGNYSNASRSIGEEKLTLVLGLSDGSLNYVTVFDILIIMTLFTYHTSCGIPFPRMLCLSDSAILSTWPGSLVIDWWF